MLWICTVYEESYLFPSVLFPCPAQQGLPENIDIFIKNINLTSRSKFYVVCSVLFCMWNLPCTKYLAEDWWPWPIRSPADDVQHYHLCWPCCIWTGRSVKWRHFNLDFYIRYWTLYRRAEVFSKRFLCNNIGFLQKVSENQVSYSNLPIFLCHPPFRMFEADFIPTFH